jgi:hypothetical protein
MRQRLGILLLACAPAFCAPSEFNGRWDITATGARAWWVELNGVGTPEAAGKFVSAFGGDMNKITTIDVKGDELTFTIMPNNAGAKRIYHAHLIGGKLQGTAETEGQSRSPEKWTGVRAPVVAD